MESRMEVVLSVKVDMSGVLCNLDSSTDTTYMMIVGGSGAFYHLDSLTALYRRILILMYLFPHLNIY